MGKTTATDTSAYSTMTIADLENIMTAKETAFTEQYEITNDIALSAQRTGYKTNKSRSAYAAGIRMLRNPKITAYLTLRRQELFDRLHLDTETLAILAWNVYKRTMQGTPRVFWNHETQTYEPDGTVLTDCKSAICALKLTGDIIRASGQKPTEKIPLDDYLNNFESEDL